MENEFWEIASKWYFFPLILLVFVLFYHFVAHYSILAALITPSLGYSFLTPKAGLDAIFIYAPVFYLLFISGVILISYYKNKKQKILKWMIIAMIVYLLVPIILLIISSIIMGRIAGLSMAGPF